MSLGEDGHSQLGAGFKVTAHECRPPVMIAQQPTLAGLLGRATGGQVETQVKSQLQHRAWTVGSSTLQYQREQRRGKILPSVYAVCKRRR